METAELTFNDKVRIAMDSGIKPFELMLVPIVDLYDGLPFAYRTKTLIHSSVLGDLKENEYVEVSDNCELASMLFEHNFQHVLNAVLDFKAENSDVEFLTVRCPSKVIEQTNIYDMLSNLLKQYSKVNPKNVCIEFNQDILDIDKDKLIQTFKDLKLLKVKTAIRGCGKDDFLISKLINICPTYVILDKDATVWVGNKNKPLLLNSLIDYIKSIGPLVLAEGDKKNFKALQRTDCIGFIDSDEITHSLTESINQREEDEISG